MGQRQNLQTLLKTLCDNVYFQPKSDTRMDYPAIVYQRDAARTTFANNLPYLFRQRYQVTVIDRDADSEIVPKVAALPMCTYNRGFAAESLNHDVFTIYF